MLSIETILKSKGYETELITLNDYKIQFCKGCEVCILKGGCFIQDDSNLIMQKIIESDGLVIGTPVYLNNMSGILKSFIDRTCSWFHRSEVSQKPTLVTSFKEIYTYNVQRTLATNVFEVDKEYWQNRGLINRPYYPNTKLNVI